MTVAVPAVRAAQILDAIHAVTVLPASTAPIRTRYMTANGSGTAAGTELATSAGYTSGVGAPATTWAAGVSTAAPATAQNSVAVSTTNMPATTVVGIEEWDSAATPVRQEWGALSANKTTNAGDTLSFAAGAITDNLG